MFVRKVLVSVGVAALIGGVGAWGASQATTVPVQSPAVSSVSVQSPAVPWALSHVGASSADYDDRCDHVVGLAYGRPASGHVNAAMHWIEMPVQYKHFGRDVPAGGLAFFDVPGSPNGHVMISIGGGKFVSNDITAAGLLSLTTIDAVEYAWHAQYVGWSDPWF